MGLIQDNRPRDWTYRVAFDKKDLPSLQEMIKHIRETHDVEMIERFNNNCDQFLQGDNPEFPTAQPINISKTDDLVVNVGLQQCINIILGTSAVRWSHIQSTSAPSALTPSVADVQLYDTSPHIIPMTTYGWMEAKGMKLFFAAIYPQDTNSPYGGLTQSEIGVCNGLASPPTSILLNRENFYNNPLQRTIAPDLSVITSVFLFSCVVEFCPVA